MKADTTENRTEISNADGLDKCHVIFSETNEEDTHPVKVNRQRRHIAHEDEERRARYYIEGQENQASCEEHCSSNAISCSVESLTVFQDRISLTS